MNLNNFNKQEDPCKKFIFIEKNNIVIATTPWHFPGAGYRIPLNRCDTLENILSWVRHINSKPWMTQQLVDYFIDLACKHHGLKMVDA